MIMDEALIAAVHKINEAAAGPYTRTWSCELAEANLQSIYDNVLIRKDTIAHFKEACDNWIQVAAQPVENLREGII